MSNYTITSPRKINFTWMFLICLFGYSKQYVSLGGGEVMEMVKYYLPFFVITVTQSFKKYEN